MKEFSQSRIDYFRDQLNISPGTLLVNSGSWGAVARKALHAVAEEVYQDGLFRRQKQDGVMDRMLSLLEEYRREVARFLACSPEEIAVCESTTGGLNICLWGFDFYPGDEIVTGNLENSAMYAALNTIAHRRGVVVKYADFGKWGEKDSLSAVKDAITKKTKMVILSHVSYFTGVATDIKAISKLCRERNILSVFDGVQAVATRKLDMKEFGCDCYAGASHKFLCGPDGAGFLYVSKEAQKLIEPTISGVFTDAGHGLKGYFPKDTAEKYDVSTRPYYVQAGSMAAIKYFCEEVGQQAAFEQIHKRREELRKGLSELPGATVRSLKQNSEESAVVLFQLEGWDEMELGPWLISQRINCRPAQHHYPPQYSESAIGVRLAVNYWNTREDIESVLRILRYVAQNPRRQGST